MAFIINTNYKVNAPEPIDSRMVVETVDGALPSLISLETGYNYDNIIVWVREEKAFYYLKDSPSEFGATASDWVKFSGGGATGCAKSGYVSGTSFTGNPATASVVFGTPYESASYSVVVTGEAYNADDYVYSVIDKTSTGFIIRIDQGGPIGATAMWITNCWDGSGLSSGGAAGAQGPTGPGGGGSAIDLEEIAFGTGTGITSSDIFTFDPSTANFLLGSHKVDNSFRSSIIGATGSIICNSTHSIIINSSLDNVYGAKICESKNAIIINSPRSCITNESGAYCNVSRQFIIGGYLHTMCQKEGPGVGNGYLGGSGILGGAGNCIYTGAIHSLILGGRCNVLKNLNYYNSFFSDTYKQKYTGGRSVIVGGENNLLSGPKIDGSVIIGGCTNSITSGTLFSTIVGGCRNTIATSSNSTIIGGGGNSMTASCYSTIIGSRNSCIIGGTATSIEVLFGGLGIACRSQILSGNLNRIHGSEDSFMIGSRGSIICRDELAFMIGNVNSCMHNSNGISLRSDSLFATGSESIASIVSDEATFCSNICNSTMIGGSDNCIFTSVSSVIINSFDSGISGSGYSTIINSRKSTVTASFFSSIISSTISCISDSNHSIILGSTSSLICNKSGISSMNSIISGAGNCIQNTSGGATINTSILGGQENRITSSLKAGVTYNSVIIGGSGNKIASACNTVIIGGENLSVSGDITGGGFSNVVVVPSFRGNGSFALSIATSSQDIIFLDETNFTLITYPPITGMTVSLPRASFSNGRIYVIKKDGSSTQSVVRINPNVGLGDTIEGYSGPIELINPWDYNILQSDGVNMWIKLGGAVGLNL